MKRSEIAISASLVPIDYLMIILAGIVSYYIRFWEPVKNIRPVVFNLSFNAFLSYLFLIAFIWLISFALAGLYSMRGTRRTIDEISKIVLGCSTAVMILMFVFFFSRNLFDSRFIILAGWLFSIIFILIGRGLVRTVQRRLYGFNIGTHRVIIIGKGAVAEEVASNFNKDIKAGFKVVDQFADFSEVVESQLQLMVKDDKFDEILVATPNLSPETLERINDFSYINHVALKYVADIFEFPINNFEINNISGLPIVEVKKTSLDGWGRISKRVFDLIISTIIIVVLSPIFLLTALAIKLDSRGSVFFTYRRIGEQGREFSYFKFRSMISDAHKYRFDEEFLKEHQNLRAGTPMMKFKDDPRITRVGKVIRRFSIDELPELFNVFIGKMSLVGPRPHEIEEVARYQNYHRKVLTIKPGMTGMAQVSGRSDLNFDEEVRLDVWYMENWSLKLDLMILFKTPLAVLKKRKTE
ncbi:MAG: sugar transferase [Patescibacteria group bacterium]